MGRKIKNKTFTNLYFNYWGKITKEVFRKTTMHKTPIYGSLRIEDGETINDFIQETIKEIL